MPDALKTDATLVRGCSASVWVYPVPRDDGALHFLADSNAAITKGIVALVLSAVQDKPAAEVADMVPGGVPGLRTPLVFSRSALATDLPAPALGSGQWGFGTGEGEG